MKLYEVRIMYEGVSHGLKVTLPLFRSYKGVIKYKKKLQKDPCYNSPDALWLVDDYDVNLWQWIRRIA